MTGYIIKVTGCCASRRMTRQWSCLWGN